MGRLHVSLLSNTQGYVLMKLQRKTIFKMRSQNKNVWEALS